MSRSSRAKLRVRPGLGSLSLALCLAASAPAQDLGSTAGGAEQVDPSIFVVAPREVDWSELVSGPFDPAWMLPEDDPTGFLARVAALPGLSLADAAGEPLVVPGCERPLAVLGDLVLAVRALRKNPDAMDALLRDVARARPALWSRSGELLTAILRDDALFRDDWSPDDRTRDGFFFGPERSLEGATRAPWNALQGSRTLQQAVMLMGADAAAIKTVENDYVGYMDHIGAPYEEIRPLPGTYLRGLDPEDRPFAAVQIVFRCDLPFPFTTYTCRLHILNRIDAAGRFVADVYSTSDDFYWLAGRDLMYPVRDSDGTLAGTLVVRVFGFDLDGVPDGDDARRASIRSGLGNLKRRAERLPDASVGLPADGAGQGDEETENAETSLVPAFEVRGKRP